MHPNVRLDLSPTAYLAPLGEAEVTEAYVQGLNDPVVHRFLVGPRSRRQTPELVREFVRANQEDPNAILFGLFVDGTLRGTARLHDIGPAGAYLGLAIFDRVIWGQGWGRKVVAALTRYAIDDLRVPRVQAVIESENVGSLRAFSHSGYVHRPEGDRPDGEFMKELWESAST